MVGVEDGARAVQIARRAVEQALGVPGSTVGPPGPAPGLFQERRGAFVTWYEHPGRFLRGCIGYPGPVLPLGDALREAAVAAALEDPRFPPVTARELGSLVVEVSLLSPFEPVPLPARPRGVEVGRDGLVVEDGRHRGLLLPQVAPEQGWTAEEFLDGTCEKAGLPPGAWRSSAAKVFRFTAEVFREQTPGGEVVRAPLLA